jgi:hypothetical protein
MRTLLLIAVCFLTWAISPPVWGEDGWRAEFDATCGKTEVAMTLSESELISLTEACDRLEKIIAGLESSERKVFQRRLQLCENFFLSALETKRNEKLAK